MFLYNKSFQINLFSSFRSYLIKDIANFVLSYENCVVSQTQARDKTLTEELIHPSNT